MANAYSIQRNRQGWIDPTDQDFTLKAMMFKQQKYDANQAKVQSVVEQYSALQLARGVDKDYLNQRLKALVDNVNSSGGMDYGSNAVTNSIQYHLGQALDENVMTAMQETAKIKSYQAEVAKIKEKNPELYNSLNEAYGISPAQEYLQNDQVGAKINGSLTYTPYKDIEGEVQKTLLEIQTKAKDGSYEYEVAPGKLAKVTVNGKSAAELREIALGMMGDRYNPQFTINAWGKHGGFKNLEGATQNVSTYYDGLVTATNKDITDLQAQLTSGKLAPSKVDEIKDRIKALENQKLVTQNNKNIFLKDPVSGLVAMEKDNVASRIGKSLGLLQTKSMEYKKDDYWFSAQTLNLETAKFEHTKQKDAAQMEWEKKKWEEEKQLKINDQLLKASGGDGSSDGTKGSKSGEVADDEFVQIDGKNDVEQNLAGSNTQVVQDIVQTRSMKNAMGKQIMQSIVNIATGANGRVEPEKKNQAIQLLNQYKAKHGTLDPKKANEGQIQAFMNLYSRGDAYTDLAFLPDVTTTKSATGEHAGAANLKQAWSTLNNEFLVKKSSYEQARARAQADERASGKPRHFTENQQFKEYLGASLSKLANNQAFTKVLNKKDIGRLNGLLMANNVGTSLVAAEGGNMMIRKISDKEVEITYQGKAKGEDKEAVMQKTAPIRMSTEMFTKYFEGAKKAINFGTKKPVFTFSNTGTKQFVSSTLGYMDPHDTNFNAYKADTGRYLPGQEAALEYLTRDGAKKGFSAALSAANNSKDAGKVKTLVNVLSSQELMNKLKIVTQFAQSYDGSGQAHVLVKLIDPVSKQTILSRDLGPKDSLDDEKNLGEYQPQILYTQLVGEELLKVMANYKAGNLELSEGLETLLKKAYVKLDD